jgi:hypothetical protein
MTEHAKYPFFPDNIQFWYETKRAFGAISYRATEFGHGDVEIRHFLRVYTSYRLF